MIKLRLRWASSRGRRLPAWKSNKRTRFALGILLAATSTRGAHPNCRFRESCHRTERTTRRINVELRCGDEGKQIAIDAQNDAQIAGDRIRIAATRDAKSIVSVERAI